ncbi:MAG: hypothetical protein K8S99_01905 [Planctomycetes bacterium]|nr:hypothetical protein [Planctomycetota bacterium]
MMQHTNLHLRIAVVSLLFLSVGIGCASTPTMQDEPTTAGPAARPARLSVELYTAWKDHRYTYIKLTDKGVLGYTGGRDATQRVFKPITTLSDAQLDAVWAVIRKYNLTEAKDTMFGTAERVTYQASISTGGLGHNFRTTDDKVPGVKELHDLLFGYQADVQFKVQGIGGGK